MKKIIASACAVAALSLGAPASAQSGILGDIIQGVFGGSSRRVGNYDDRINAAYQRGEISSAQARDLQNRYIQLVNLEQRYRQNGLSGDERYDLERRANDLQRRLEYARNGNNYDNGYYNDGRDGRNGCPPGLSRKNNGCLPPGQVGRDNNRYGETSAYRDTDRYVWQQDRSGRMVQVDRRTGQVVRVANR
jgi:hypothetical protein